MIVFVRVYDIAAASHGDDLLPGSHVVFADGFSSHALFVDAVSGKALAVADEIDEEDLENARRVSLFELPVTARDRLRDKLAIQYAGLFDRPVTELVDDPSGLTIAPDISSSSFDL